MLEAKVVQLLNEPIVWINIGVLIYYSAGLFYYALFNYSVQISKSFIYNTVKINATTSIFFFLLIAIGFWKAGRQKQVR